MTYSKADVLKKIDEIPQNLQDLFFSPEKSDAVRDIGLAAGLDDARWKKLLRATNAIILCIQPLSTYRSLLMGDVGLTYDQAVKMTVEITEKIFAPVMESLKKFEADPHVYDPIHSESEEEVSGEEGGEFLEEEQDEAEETPTVTADHLIPTHETMEKESGSHIHTQTTMPQAVPASRTSTTSTPSSTPVQPSIVDQKLRGLVRPHREEMVIRDDVEKRRKIIYKDTDPYREPIE